MAVPTTRETFKDNCLRRLGAPVVDINVDNQQVEDRIDEALRYYHDYHYDGTEQVILKHQITQTDKDNEYIPLTENIIGIQDVLPVGAHMNTQNLFSIRYQLHLNDMFNFTAGTLTPYVMAMRHIETLEEVFVGKQLVRFNRHTDRLHIDMDWAVDVLVGDYIIILAYRAIDVDTWTDVWSDWWLQRYCTALIKRQWGNNLKKFEGMQLPGGMQFNGQTIYNEAIDEIKDLETEMNSGWSLPVTDLMG